MKQGIVFILVGFYLSPAWPLPLQPLPEIQKVKLQVNQEQGRIPCADISARLDKYADMSRNHNNSVTAFLNQLVEKLTEWHDVLSPLENKPANLEAGTFDVLSDASQSVSLATDYAIDNSTLLANELDRIIVSLKDCSISNIEVSPHGRGVNHRNISLH
jgi:hypothetical protein